MEMVHERCESWKSTVTAIIEYFHIFMDLERTKEKSYRKAAALLGPSNVFGSGGEESAGGAGTPVGSPLPSSSSPPSATATQNTSNTWLVPLQALALKGNGESESIVRFMERAALPDLQQLRDNIRMGSKQLKEQLVAILAPLHKAYESLHGSMGQHQSLWLDLLKDKDPRSEDGTDPWLQQLKLSLRVQAFLHEKHSFAQALESVHSTQRSLDAAWSGTLREIVSEFFTVYSKSTLQFGEQMQDIVALMQEVVPEQEWANALHRFRLDFGWSLETPPFDGFLSSVLSQVNHSILRNSDLPAQDIIRSFPIVRSGFLLKQSSGSFGAKSWSSLFWILSESGFMHGYAFKGDKSSSAIVHKPTGITSAKALQEANSEAAQVLLHGQVPDAALADPTVSIWLGGSNVNPVISTEGSRVDSSGCVFCVTALSSGGFFGGKGEKKYTLQSFVEEDMVDWCIAIKNVITSCTEDILPSLVNESQQAAEEHIEPSPRHQDYERYNEAQHSQQQYSSHSTQSSREHVIEDHYRAPPQESSVSRMLPPELEKNPWED